MASQKQTIVEFENPTQKARWLDHAAALDSYEAPIAERAEMIAADARSDVEAIQDVFSYVVEHEAYVRDPGLEEQFADTASALLRGFDDCDGKSRSIVAMLRALARDVPARRAIEARIRAVFFNGEFVHVQVEARGQRTDEHPRARAGGWLVLDPTLEGARLGEGAEAAKIDPETHEVATN